MFREDFDPALAPGVRAFDARAEAIECLVRAGHRAAALHDPLGDDPAGNAE